MSIKVVAEGIWIYNGSVQRRVWIVEADYDFWYEMASAEGDLKPHEQPDLNADGIVYYVAFKAPEDGRFWPDGGGFKRRRRGGRTKSPGSKPIDQLRPTRLRSPKQSPCPG
jgi:hypothetical protein